jgi:pimeloyl-ACP methyl ester carboxylesterase
VQRAAETLIADFRKPVLMAWAAEDPVFPLAHAQAYAARLSNARVETLADACSFTAEDQPEKLADLVAAFIAETGGGA